MEETDIWKNKDIRSARMNALNNATRLICSMIEAGHFKNQNITIDLMFSKIQQQEQRFYDEIYKGMDEGELKSISSTETPKVSPHTCFKCKKVVSEDVVRWCTSHKDKYDSQILCRECQQEA